ncbi:16S rRNA (cytosine(1402)-N(4))-methyltransferase RsmH [Limimonas halophila]
MAALDRDQQGAHTPVMLDPVLAALNPRAGMVYVDATFGRGGYTRALLDHGAHVIALDRDPNALAHGRELVGEHGDRLQLLQGRFGELDALLAEHGVGRVDGVVFDLGVASPQLDDPERGFSFRFDGPLDMRMGRDGPTAADVVNTADVNTLTCIIRDYGEEKKGRAVARAIAAAREHGPFTRTGELAEVVRRAVGRRAADGLDPATRTFQGLRIHVNDELGELARGLTAAERVLAPGGRLVVVAFHSLEDRAVKRFLRERSGDRPNPSRHAPAPADTGAPAPSFRLLTRSARKPSEAEAAANPRARSARMRAAERTDAPAWPTAESGVAP